MSPVERVQVIFMQVNLMIDFSTGILNIDALHN